MSLDLKPIIEQPFSGHVELEISFVTLYGRDTPDCAWIKKNDEPQEMSPDAAQILVQEAARQNTKVGFKAVRVEVNGSIGSQQVVRDFIEGQGFKRIPFMHPEVGG